MPTYLHPGVYVEEIPSGARPIEGVGTSTAIFLGYTVKGAVGEPVPISKWDDYAQLYGGYRDTGLDAKGDPMAYSVAAFFQNGGSHAYIVRLATATQANPLTKAAGYQNVPGSARVVLFEALNEGAWANGLVVQITAKATAGLYVVDLGRLNEKGVFVPAERFNDVAFDSASPRFLESVINGFSSLVTASVKADASTLSSLTIASSYRIGSSVSKVLTDADLNFLAVPETDRTLKLSVDGGPPTTVILPASDYSGKSADLAKFIQDTVRLGAAAGSPRALFAAVVSGDRLVLQSNTAKPESAVTVVGNAALRCRVDAAHSTAAPGVGVSISDDLTGAEPDFTGDAAPARILQIAIDHAAPIEVTIPAQNFAGDLAPLAAAIQSSVTSGATAGTPQAKFTAAAEGMTLVLRSNTSGTSAVEVTGAAAAKCKLGVANGGEETAGGGTLTGDLLAGADLNFKALGEPDRTLNVAVDSGAAVPIILPSADYGQDLPGVAALIQQTVRGDQPADSARGKFTAFVRDSRLVLQSNTGTTSSKVEVTGNAAARLKMGSANGGEEKDGSANEAARKAAGPIELAGGANGAQPDSATFDACFARLKKYHDINIVCLPGQEWKGFGKAMLEKAIAHATDMRDRMVIVDVPSDLILDTEVGVNDLTLSASTYAVLYYPWIKAVNVNYDAEKAPGAPETVLVPPSGFAAGMWAKIDGRRGVWKAPAGVETALLGAAGLNATVDEIDQDSLNPLGVNCVRKLPGFGPVIWGTRTLATKADPEWRYVPIRRTAIMIEQSIYGGIQWAVFEPNNHNLWSSLRANIVSFMDGLFRSGAFQGEKASDAYFVRCGLGDTMTQDDIDRGQVIVIVGFAPLKPAEFVIVRIQQKVAQQ